MKNRDLDWNMYSLVLIGLILFLQVFHSYQYPQFLDEYFHLHNAWSIEYWKGFSCVDLLQNAPVGRPNLYPPFYHSLINIIHKTEIDWITIAKIFSVLIIPLFCLVFYFIFKNLISEMFGFVFILLVFSNYGFSNSLINNIPATISMIFWGLSFFCFIKNKFLTSALLLSLCFYTHPVLGYAGFILLFVWAIITKKSKSLYYLLSPAIASPFIFHQFYNRHYLSFSSIGEGMFIEFKILEICLCIAGIIVIFMYKDKREEVKLFFLALVLGFGFSMVSGYRYRVFVSQGFLPVIFFATYFLCFILKQTDNPKKKAIFILGVFILFTFLSPSFIYSGEKEKLVLFDSFFVNSLKDIHSQKSRSLSIWSAKFYNPIISIIKDNTNEHDIIFSDMESLGVMFSLLAGRPTSSSMFDETKPFSDFDRVGVSKMVIYLKSLEPGKDLKVLDYFSKRNFELFTDLPLFYIFKNPNPLKVEGIKKQIIIDQKLLYGFWITIFCSIIFSYVLKK
jgi:hypothetical protein